MSKLLENVDSAFDSVGHDTLLEHQENLIGLKGLPLAWFCSYLSDRTQRVI